MTYNLRIAFFVTFFGSLAITGAFMMPPLTSAGGGGLQGTTKEEYDQAVNSEYAFCRESMPGADCSCIAYKAGVIKSSKAERVHGLVYADKDQLARDQAVDVC